MTSKRKPCSNLYDPVSVSSEGFRIENAASVEKGNVYRYLSGFLPNFRLAATCLAWQLLGTNSGPVTENRDRSTESEIILGSVRI